MFFLVDTYGIYLVDTSKGFLITSSKIPVVDCILFCPKIISPKVGLKTSKPAFAESLNSWNLKYELNFNTKNEINWA